MPAHPEDSAEPVAGREIAGQVGDRLGAWVDAVAGLYPPGDAEAWDQVGLHVGDPAGDRVHGVLVALDVTAEVLQEAAALGADLVLAHHPLLFSPLGRLTPDTASGRLALMAARQGCAVMAAHTNVDKAAAGTSHPAARVLDLRDLRPLRPLDADPGGAPVKLVTFVPGDHTASVVEALTAVGAGTIGEYTGCAYRVEGTGTFVPGAAADPHIGRAGEREEVAEDRVEMVLPRRLVGAAVAALEAAHPYEEVAHDLYPLLDSRPSAERGLGLVGDLPEPLTLHAVARRLAEGLPSPGLRLATDDPERQVRRVGICGGAGDSLIADVLDGAHGPSVDVFVTGDLKHHPTLDARTMGLSLIDAGHFPTENPAMDDVVAALEQARPALGLRAPLHRSRVNTDPWIDWRAIP